MILRIIGIIVYIAYGVHYYVRNFTNNWIEYIGKRPTVGNVVAAITLRPVLIVYYCVLTTYHNIKLLKLIINKGALSPSTPTDNDTN